ncbi:MAG TPA: hypothetical protein DCQ26_17735 [Marinilabiliales bacterium]|nr:hypothetical protein [Marinilabiliales bacterium]HAZ02744.1 hypothetical protein [Marinilabiliales bacterium]HBX86150.1 hypothetical protein [Marinilabiliales bacterium]HBY52577.1 hypothetical protein [Marinilabiliales bacterium]
MIQMKTTVHKAETRGSSDHGWLKTNFTFSFADYYNPERIHFGKLRVINDDTIAPGMGFGLHPHDNMEIITIPLSGAVKHTDNTDGFGIIKHGEVQVMSAGTGIWHSEFNASETEELKLLQIWIFPDKIGVKPGYKTQSFGFDALQNEWLLVAGPVEMEGSHLKINQQAFVSFGKIEKGKQLTYKNYLPANGVYLFVVEGNLAVEGSLLERRDGIGIEGEPTLQIGSMEDSQFVIFEIPMK